MTAPDITACPASTTRKSTTAFTLAGTLSRVMISCGGMVRVTTRISTRISLSAPGSSTPPGPAPPKPDSECKPFKA